MKPPYALSIAVALPMLYYLGCSDPGKVSPKTEESANRLETTATDATSVDTTGLSGSIDLLVEAISDIPGTMLNIFRENDLNQYERWKNNFGRFDEKPSYSTFILNLCAELHLVEEQPASVKDHIWSQARLIAERMPKDPLLPGEGFERDLAYQMYRVLEIDMESAYNNYSDPSDTRPKQERRERILDPALEKANKQLLIARMLLAGQGADVVGHEESSLSSFYLEILVDTRRERRIPAGQVYSALFLARQLTNPESRDLWEEVFQGALDYHENPIPKSNSEKI